MINKKMLLALVLAQGIAYSTLGQANRQFSGEQISVANQTKVFSDDCKEHYVLLQNSYDTLGVAYDAAIVANEDCEEANQLLTEDLQVSKVLTQSCEQENKDLEKTLKRQQRANKFNKALLWGLSGVTAVMVILYVVK